MIKVNNKVISKSGLILRPGERIYLDCFLDDRKKFKFETYTVDNTKEVLNAISDNGLIEISFYKEDIVTLEEFPRFDWTYRSPISYQYKDYFNSGSFGTNTQNTLIGDFTLFGNNIDGNFVGDALSTVLGNNTSINQSNLFNQNLSSKTIETGQISKGDASEQKFNEVNMKFSNYQLGSIKYKLLPSSTKPLTSNDIKPKNFCNKCGRKLLPTDCFCGSCGNKLK